MSGNHGRLSRTLVLLASEKDPSMWQWLVGGAFLWWLLKDEHPGAFISFASEDARYRDHLMRQVGGERTPFKFKDHSLHEPFSERWKTQTREIIRGSDMLILMIGTDTHRAEGAIWEVKAALEEGVPVFGVHINKDPPGRVPAIMKGHPVIRWTHPGIAREVRRAVQRKRRAA